MITQLRIAWRLQRWEIAFVVVACLGLAAAAALQAADMRSLLTDCGTPAAARACGFIYPFQDSHGMGVQLTQMAITYVPFVAGLVLGVPVVAREVEQRTALIAWPLAGSRLRWLVWRLAPVFIIGLAVVAILAVAADQLAHAYLPNSDLGFVEYASRGLPFVMRSTLMLVSGVAIGALLGRVLPALLVGIGASVAVLVVLAMALPHWVPSTELGLAESVESGPGSINTDLQYRTPDGQLIDAEAADQMIAAAYEASGGAEPDPSVLPRKSSSASRPVATPRCSSARPRCWGSPRSGMGAVAGVAVSRRRPE